MQRNVAKDCSIPFSLIPYPVGEIWKILGNRGEEREGGFKWNGVRYFMRGMASQDFVRG